MGERTAHRPRGGRTGGPARDRIWWTASSGVASPRSGQAKAAARIESSKSYAKGFDATTPASPRRTSATFVDHGEASGLRAGARARPPIVVKASGLAAGKGAVVCQTVEEALRGTREHDGRPRPSGRLAERSS